MKLPEFQRHLKKNSIDLVFLRHPDINITYFTQEKFSHSYLLITPTKSTLYITSLDKIPTIPNIKVKILTKSFEQEFKKISPKTIGINKELLPIISLEKLQQNFPNAKFINISEKLKELRSTKTPTEINHITKACHLTSQAFHTLIQELKKNNTPTELKTEQDIALFLEKYIRSHGAEIAFPTIVANGKNAAIPHHITSTKLLEHGFLLLDFGAMVNGYCADMSRTIFLGIPNKKEQDSYNLLIKSQTKTINQIAENKLFAKLDSFCRQQLGSASHHFTHSLGHGLGLEVHEEPSYTKQAKIKTRQIFTIEPGIYIKNQFGIRIEDTILFNGQVKILTTAPKDLLITIPKFR